MFVAWVAAFITERTCIILRLSNDKISLSFHLTLHYDICSIISIYSSMTTHGKLLCLSHVCLERLPLKLPV